MKMECVRASFERLAVRGEAGVAYEEAVSGGAFQGGTFESASIKLNAKLEASIMLLNNHVALDQFTVDVVALKDSEEDEEREKTRGGVLNFIQERLVGSRNSRSKEEFNNNTEIKAQNAIISAWDTCRVKGFHSLYALAKITTKSLPDNACRERYSAGHYAEALLVSSKAYFMFQRHNPLFQPGALGLWGSSGAGCASEVDVCYLVLAWRLNERETVKRVSPLSLFNTTANSAVTAAAATPPRQSQKRGAVSQDEGRSIATPASKRARVSPVTPPSVPHEAAREELEEEEEVKIKEQLKDKIPEVWYSPDITLPIHKTSPAKQTASTPSPVRQPPPAPPSSKKRPGRPPATPRPAPANHTQEPAPTPVTQPSTPPQATREAEEDLSDITLGFERSTPRGRGRGRGRTSTATPRKSVLLPQWSEEERDELLEFFDTLNPSQTEQTCIALTCKFATMRFGRDLPSKQLYQWVQQKNRTVHPRPQEYSLPGGDAGVRTAAAELYRSLNQDVSESKRVAFTCRFMQTQYGVELSSKELFSILSGGGPKRGRRAR